MKKSTVVISVLCAAALTVTLCGVMLLISLADYRSEQIEDGWNMIFMMPQPAVAIAAVALILTDAACVALAVILAVSYVRTGRALKNENRAVTERFSRLMKLDREGVPGSVTYNDRIGLYEFCEGFRNYAAAEMGLYYDARVIRSFVAGMSATHLIILQGISGTGKTSLPFAFGKYVCRDAAVTPVQPGWKDRSDLLGYYNEFTDSYTETELLCKLYEADMCGDICTVVLDEMNIARVEYYFAEFLSLLELPEGTDRRLRVTADSRDNDPALFEGGTLKLPDNVWFVGTANNDDSTLAISDKVYDRAFVIELNGRCKPFPAESAGRAPVSYARLTELFDAAAREHPASERVKGILSATDEYLSEHLGVSAGNRVMRQAERFIPVFVSCGGGEDEAADILICRKLLRKLDGVNPVLVRSEADGIARFLDGAFGEYSPSLSLAYVNRFRSVN